MNASNGVSVLSPAWSSADLGVQLTSGRVREECRAFDLVATEGDDCTGERGDLFRSRIVAG